MEADPRIHYGIGTSHTLCCVTVVKDKVFESHVIDEVTCKDCRKGLRLRLKDREMRSVNGTQKGKRK